MKLLIVNNTLFRGKHVEAGSVLDLDEKATQDGQDARLLIHSGKAVEDTPANRKVFEREHPPAKPTK